MSRCHLVKTKRTEQFFSIPQTSISNFQMQCQRNHGLGTETRPCASAPTVGLSTKQLSFVGNRNASPMEKHPDRRRGATSQCGHSASTSKNDAKFQGNIHCRFFTPRPGVSFHKTGQWAKTAGLGLQPSLNEVLRLSLSGTGCI